MSGQTLLERSLERDSFIVLAGLAGVTTLAWLWIVPMALDMYGPMTGPSMWMMTAEWDAKHLALLFGMWAAMMIGMMLPSAAPTILLYVGVARRASMARPAVHAWVFAAGYLVMWSIFAAAAVAAQRLLSNALLMTPMMELSSTRAASVVVALAGLYQLTSFKRTCLSACRSPADFVARHWRPGLAGAFRMGLTHGLFCLGCCWALMLLLFAGGVMHLTTIVLLTIFVLLEKLLPLGRHASWFARATGTGLLALAAWMLR